MEKLINADQTVLNILGKAKVSEGNYRLMKYCVVLEVEDGMLLFNVLTRELLLLTGEEYADCLESEYLREKWFVIPEKLNEKEYADLVRWACRRMDTKEEYVTKYTILTTTECNARCFYCYEKGCKKVTMSEETADKAASFIKEQCGKNAVNISWFGGEPLVNYKVIDRITEKLKSEGIRYLCSMVSNGYLFDDEIVQKAVNHWELKNVQITLDGTEDVYNRSKAYVYDEGSAYQVVLGNIERLLNAGVQVTIRLNMNLKNAENLLQLAEELAVCFPHEKKPTVYAHLIYEENVKWDKYYTDEELKKLYDTMKMLEEKLSEQELFTGVKQGLRKSLKMRNCMADDGRSLVVLPDGHLGLCEHYTETNLIGHIDSKERDQTVIAKWKELDDEIAECADCFYFPECIRLRKCPGLEKCSEFERQRIQCKVKRAMMNELKHWNIKGLKNNDV